MDTMRILLTGVGCPGAVTVIKALKYNGEREVHIIGTDMNPDAGGRWFVDEFYSVLAGDDPGFIGHMQALAARIEPDVIFPQITNECIAWSLHKEDFDCPIMVDDAATVLVCSDKALTYQALTKTDVPLPEWYLCDSLMELAIAIIRLGYPRKPICIKPLKAKGMRGFHVISADESERARLFLEGRPGEMPVSFFGAYGLLSQYEDFPSLLAMEYIEGEETCMDIFCDNGEILMGFGKTREDFRAGLAYKFRVFDDVHLWNSATIIAKKLNLSFFANVQFKGDHLMEINPRISTMLLWPDFNMPWLAVKRTLGLADDEELTKACLRALGTQEIWSRRYHDQVFLKEGAYDQIG